MTKTIAHIWDGTLQPVQYLGNNNSNINHLLYEQEHSHRELKAALSEEAQKLLQKHTLACEEYSHALIEQSFCDGFCLGAKITAEAFVGAEQII